MLQVIKCPACAAPLECDGDAFEKCEFCGSQVVVNKNDVFNYNSVGFDGMLQNASKVKEILHLATNGNKIEAIKKFRETFGVGLNEATYAVDRLERRQSVNFRNIHNVSPQAIKIDTKTSTHGAKVVGGINLIAVVILVILALLGVGIAVFSVYKSVN